MDNSALSIRASTVHKVKLLPTQQSRKMQSTSQPQAAGGGPGLSQLGEQVNRAWTERCSSLGLTPEEIEKFESNAASCKNLPDYLALVEAACKRNKENSHVQKAIDWLEPINNALELFTPAAAVAIQAYPNPGSLVLGGIVGILQTTKRLVSWQKLALKNLSRMGRKARLLFEYETDIYKDNDRLQAGLVKVYGHILAFCQKGFRLMKKKGKLLAKVEGLACALIRDFESSLGDIVEQFEQDLEDLEDNACLCDRRWLKALHDSHQEHQKDLSQFASEARQQFQQSDARNEDMFKLWKRNQDHLDRK